MALGAGGIEVSAMIEVLYGIRLAPRVSAMGKIENWLTNGLNWVRKAEYGAMTSFAWVQ